MWDRRQLVLWEVGAVPVGAGDDLCDVWIYSGGAVAADFSASIFSEIYTKQIIQFQPLNSTTNVTSKEINHHIFHKLVINTTRSEYE
jgi:hypothetical protein